MPDLGDRGDAPEAGGADDGGSREQNVLAARRGSLLRLRAAGREPFAISLRTALGVDEPTPTDELRDVFGRTPPDERLGERRVVAGRAILKRDMGKLKFLTLRDRSGDIQVVFMQSALADDEFALLDEVDLGDIVAVSGEVGTTRKGELSVFADRWAMLTKALRPLPEKWHGLRDPDLQQRWRELHLATDPSARRMVEARATMLRTIREDLDRRGFLEVETPLLQPVAGGALARPFVTHHRALDVPLYLRIALELYLKRLLVGGLERVYEIGRIARNEGIDRDHNPEFTMLEVYQAYGDYETMMVLTRELVQASALAVNGSLVTTFRGEPIDLSGEWRRVTVLGSVGEKLGENITLDRPDLAELAASNGVRVEAGWGPGKIVLEMFEKLVEHTLIEPTFACDFPREVSPLARPHRDHPELTEQFDLVIGGIELATAYSELSDPDEQRAKFALQQTLKAAGDDEAHPLDEGFLRALEHGMPPAGGMGIGMDRLLKLLLDAPSLRDLILFPHHRPDDA
jgi:lysyl-tRNA synthetase class 2